ncbi:hypothetical protein A3C09_02175 [Candidatus Uhrbacteria bacterium RIFCSPHIGHO2_02_FULL_47_44]|uniref:Flavoprotein domain-containing protein n=1 Tax=Candidatus Uhrbacteria bacterium RIFCSPLOWO2_02_FULL_48_18 TaxID=1802408 RepID=A0A1F7VCS7_9BACT|nr:MAG: hypothetical protein A2839_04625 [Candidatus Uhrbacteria bacterium RIFCSPHIGHO2_01_FULL_47_10]OGL70486.1 MAG: hypothetical protein A3C09_02175 [Candidatus Uhrbacteria bacterium RIFCSPHIGHO2_02_FULL_47_44]OGL77368.1 MAG: hypothetical protein A3E97_03225 [Candidatus Uhrbacteria bacterium RIFCSPHIGHO2_12_FULL_47_12]OGL82291.1 MAG: hypothetical protein A3B20_00880 [Candidatus Uhrbacteria bacterium RIFCSPLOWO2_01_FULL_47_17]OGL87938.1 MAG: hypothetical protein A3I41_02410 [Candidatus Uhrbact
MKVLLGVTGSVATVLVGKLVDALHSSGHEVEVVATKSSRYFFRAKQVDARIWNDEDEWPKNWFERIRLRVLERFYKKGQPIPHIDLRKWADVLVVAPLDANTLAKFSVGMCDNLLTCVFRAWDFDKPVVLAPAMNTFMWHNPITQKYLGELNLLRIMTVGTIRIVQPQDKVLACGDEGVGAMANISDIVDAVNKLNKTKTADVAALTSK